MLEMLLMISLVILALATLGCLYRVIVGPTIADRVIALDSIGINLIAITAVVSVHLKTYAYVEVILLIGILTFIGTIAFSKFIERGVVIERQRNN